MTLEVAISLSRFSQAGYVVNGSILIMADPDFRFWRKKLNKNWNNWKEIPSERAQADGFRWLPIAPHE